jgi:cell wall-associated NlpC family hydrolase
MANSNRLQLTVETLQLGDIFLTVNAKEEDNRSPGYWNHCAIYAGDNRVVEAQADPGKVIISGLTEFLARYPKIQVMRVKQLATKTGSRAGEVMAQAALKLEGRTYRALVSRFKKLERAERKGENCVTVVRRAYYDGFGEDPRWKIPDHVASDERLVQSDAK